jgi:hypothetical protein
MQQFQVGVVRDEDAQLVKVLFRLEGAHQTEVALGAFEQQGHAAVVTSVAQALLEGGDALGVPSEATQHASQGLGDARELMLPVRSDEGGAPSALEPGSSADQILAFLVEQPGFAFEVGAVEVVQSLEVAFGQFEQGVSRLTAEALHDAQTCQCAAVASSQGVRQGPASAVQIAGEDQQQAAPGFQGGTAVGMGLEAFEGGRVRAAKGEGANLLEEDRCGELTRFGF